MDSNNEYYFTFGVDHPLADFIQQVSAPSEGAARCGMRRFYADRWASRYHAEDDFLMVDGDRVASSAEMILKLLPRKIIVYGDEVYTESRTET